MLGEGSSFACQIADVHYGQDAELLIVTIKAGTSLAHGLGRRARIKTQTLAAKNEALASPVSYKQRCQWRGTRGRRLKWYRKPSVLVGAVYDSVLGSKYGMVRLPILHSVKRLLATLYDTRTSV